MSPEIFIDDLYDTFRDNDNPEEFDDQISDFDENLNQPEETRSVSVIVATSPLAFSSYCEEVLLHLQLTIHRKQASFEDTANSFLRMERDKVGARNSIPFVV